MFRNFLSYYWGMNFAPIELASPRRRGTLHFSLNFILFYTSGMRKFKYSKTAKIRAAGNTCTGTALACTGTGSVLEGCTGTGLGSTGTVWLLHHLYRYRFKGVLVQVSEICPEMLFSPFFMHLSSIIHFYFTPHQEST